MNPKQILVLNPAPEKQTSLLEALRDCFWPGEAQIHARAMPPEGEEGWDMAFVVVAGQEALEAARILRENHPDMPLFFVGQNGGYAPEAWKLNAADYLLEPVSGPRVGRAVARTFGKSPAGGVNKKGGNGK